MGEMLNIYILLVGEPEGKIYFESVTCVTGMDPVYTLPLGNLNASKFSLPKS
jgi:hypothetical protein